MTDKKSRLATLTKKNVIVTFFDDNYGKDKPDIAINDTIVNFQTNQSFIGFVDSLLESGYNLEWN